MIPYRKTLAALMLLLPLSSQATSMIEGRLNGLRCATEGICPADKQDPLITAESDFVLEKSDGTFYLIPAIKPALKARHALEQVRVTGEVHPRYQTIDIQRLEVKKDGFYKTVWTPKIEARRWEDLVQPGASRR